MNFYETDCLNPFLIRSRFKPMPDADHKAQRAS